MTNSNRLYFSHVSRFGNAISPSGYKFSAVQNTRPKMALLVLAVCLRCNSVSDLLYMYMCLNVSLQMLTPLPLFLSLCVYLHYSECVYLWLSLSSCVCAHLTASTYVFECPQSSAVICVCVDVFDCVCACLHVSQCICTCLLHLCGSACDH